MLSPHFRFTHDTRLARRSLDVTYTSSMSSSALTTMAQLCRTQNYVIFKTEAEVKGSLSSGHGFGWTKLYTITQVYCN